MALFNKEPDRIVKPLPGARPQSPLDANGPSLAPSADMAPVAKSTPSTDARAYLDKGSRVSGKLSFEGPTRIDGQVDGEITGKDVITIGEGAVVTAAIKAASVIVAGKVNGDILANNRLELRPTAKVVGNLTAPTLVIHEGAIFEGHCAMQSEPAREERKISILPIDDRQAAAHVQKQA